MGTVLHEGRHAGEAIMSEPNGSRGRGVVIIPGGTGKVAANTVCGKIAADGNHTPSPDAEIAGIEGAEVAVVVTIHAVDATNNDVRVAVIARDTEMNGTRLVYHESVDDADKTAAKHTELESKGIIVR